MTRRRRRLLVGALVALPLALAALWLGVHRIPWLGPALADGLRAIVGPAAVAWLEDVVYGVDDRVQQVWRADELPTAHWHAEAPAPEPAEAGPPPFRPSDVGPVHARITTPVDGVWVPIRYPGRDLGAPILFKTQLHPDARRPWAEVFVVAIDLSRARLWAVAGSRDPEATVAEGRRYQRPARIPEQHHPDLLAAFNGGFKTEHGQYGMMVDGVTLVRPRPLSCTIAGYADGSLVIATWKKIADTEERMSWWRQTPPCLYQDGKMHGALWEDETRGWGAAVGGETVIRRSAIGLDSERRVLYVGLGNFTTARAIGDAMHHAGADDVAQLDVNWTFPKLLLYQQGDAGQLDAHVLVEGFVFEVDEYVRKRSPRDFFYLTKR